MTVPASVAADPPVDVRATLAGKVSELVAADGGRSPRATPILKIRQETPQDPVVDDEETGEETVTEPSRRS